MSLNHLLMGKTIYGFYDMYHGSASHLTLWTWNLHCLTNYYLIYGSNSYIKNNLLISSFVGSYCILNCYLYLLYLNPKLEYDLNKNKNTLHITLRSLFLHLYPCLSISYYLFKNPIFDKNICYYHYLWIPICHLVTGHFYRLKYKKNIFNAYHIYINYDGKNSNVTNISEKVFVSVNSFIMLSTIYLCKIILTNYNLKL